MPLAKRAAKAITDFHNCTIRATQTLTIIIQQRLRVRLDFLLFQNFFNHLTCLLLSPSGRFCFCLIRFRFYLLQLISSRGPKTEYTLQIIKSSTSFMVASPHGKMKLLVLKLYCEAYRCLFIYEIL